MTCRNCSCPFSNVESGNGSARLARVDCLVTDAVKQVRFRNGDILFSAGEPSSSLYSVTSGLVKITCHTSDGREQIVGLSSPRSLLAGLQSINDECYEYSAVAATDVTACMIRHRSLLRSIEKDRDVAVRVIQAMNAQLAHSRCLMKVMGHKCAAAKLASFILLLIPESEHDHQRFTLPFSRGDIAGLLGLSEETVCRQMAKMRRRGILYAPRGKIEVHDWHLLQAIAREAPLSSMQVHQTG
jgi:CRP/FNR family transcriptional regulator